MKCTGKVIEVDRRRLDIIVDEIINDEVKELYADNRALKCEVRIFDNRSISADQRKLIYSLFKDIADYTGYAPEEVKQLMKCNYELIADVDGFSLSNCSKSFAKGFIDYLLKVVIENAIPLSKRYEYLLQDNTFFYLCIMHRVCCVCGLPHADVAHVEAVGMGRDRRTIDHTKHRFMGLCREHHIEQHTIGIDSFLNKYHIIPVSLKQRDIDKLGLNS